jgi:hypothetical protein
MNDRFARRYHWHSATVRSLTIDPHAAICSNLQPERTLNLVTAESVPAQRVITELSHQHPQELVAEIQKLPSLTLPAHHEITVRELHPDAIEKILLKTYEAKAADFETLLAMPGVGAKTLRALSLIAEIAYGTAASWRDPAKFSFAHGGKDGHPYPVDRQLYDRSVEILQRCVERAKVAPGEKDTAIKRLVALRPENPPHRRTPGN